MAYTDSLMHVESVTDAENAAITSTPTTYANGLNRIDVATPNIHFPGGATVIDFIVWVQGNALGADATRPVYSLHTGSVLGGASSEKAAVTVGPSLIAGARAKSKAFSPVNIPSGGYLKFVKKTAAGSGTNTVKCVAIVRLNGAAGTDNSLSPLSSL